MDHSRNFSRRELACRCCGRCEMKAETLRMAEKIRIVLDDCPMKITSAFRCIKHNVAVGGVSDPDNPSKHTLGMAIDFVPLGMDLKVAYEKILKAHKDGLLPELGGIGYYPEKGFIHVDIYHAPDGHLRKW